MEKDTANTELIRGHVDTIILRTLQSKDSYPYDILKEIEEKSCGKYVLKQATLYSCMKRLERTGYINSYWGTESEGGRRRYYSLTEIGKDFLTKDQQEWEFSRTLINQLLSDREVNLEEVAPPFDASSLRPLTRRVQAVDEIASNAEDDETTPATTTSVATEAALPEVLLSEQTATAVQDDIATQQVLETVSAPTELAEENAVPEHRYITRKPIFRHTASNAAESSNAAQAQPTAPVEEVARFVPQRQAADELYLSSTDEDPEELTEGMIAAASLLQLGEFRQQHTVSNIVEPIERPIERPTARATAKNSAESYRDVLGRIFDKPAVETKPTHESVAEETDIAAAPKGRHIKELQNQLAKQGYHLKIYSPKNRSDFYYNKYVYQNKINFVASLVMFSIMVVQLALIFVFQQQIGFQAPILIVACIATVLVPALYAITYFVNPSRRIRASYNFTQSVIIRLVLSLVLVGIHTIVCLISPSLGITFQNIRMYIPWMMSLNIPLYAVVYQLLYSSKKFHLTAKK